MGRRVHQSGAPVDTDAFEISPVRSGNQQQPRVAGAESAFAIVWQEYDAAGAGWEVRGRILGVADAP